MAIVGLDVFDERTSQRNRKFCHVVRAIIAHGTDSDAVFFGGIKIDCVVARGINGDDFKFFRMIQDFIIDFEKCSDQGIGVFQNSVKFRLIVIVFKKDGLPVRVILF